MKPTWWLLESLGAALVGLVGLIETSVANGAVRVFLELAAVAAVALFMLGWLRGNRARIELAETQSYGRVLDFPAAMTRTPIRKNRVKITASGRRAG